MHPLKGNTTALIIGIAGTVYGSLGVGFAAQNAMNTVWNIPPVRWRGRVSASFTEAAGEDPLAGRR